MSEKRYSVRLSGNERARLKALLQQKRLAAQKRARAQVLLKVDEGEDGPAWTDAKAAAAFDVPAETVRAIRWRLVERGLDAALERPPRPPRCPKLTPAVERDLLPWPRVLRLSGESGGPCICWPTAWSSSTWVTH